MPYFPEDIIIIIFRYFHKDKMRLLNQEYIRNLMKYRNNDSIRFKCLDFNKRDINSVFYSRDAVHYICNIRHGSIAVLSKNYFHVEIKI